MKKILLLMSLVLPLLFSACATAYPEMVSSEDCLVVIPTGFEKPSTAEFARSYYLGVAGHERDYKIPSKISGRMFIKVQADSEDLNMLNSRVTNSKYTGDPSSSSIDIPLPYQAGQVIITDFKAVQRMVKTKHNSYSSGVDFDEFSESEKEALMAELRNDPNLAGWF